MECPFGSTPRCDGSKSLASLGTDDSLRRVIESDASSSSSLSSCKSFCMHALHRQCFGAGNSQPNGSVQGHTGKVTVIVA